MMIPPDVQMYLTMKHLQKQKKVRAEWKQERKLLKKNAENLQTFGVLKYILREMAF